MRDARGGAMVERTAAALPQGGYTLKRMFMMSPSPTM